MTAPRPIFANSDGQPRPTVAVTDIVLGVRHRKDLGNIEGLAKSIAEVGLLHPIVVRPDGVLIAGERRLAAYRHLGWTDIPATIVDLAEIARERKRIMVGVGGLLKAAASALIGHR
jgi:ParB family chromosome partitioning protein